MNDKNRPTAEDQYLEQVKYRADLSNAINSKTMSFDKKIIVLNNCYKSGLAVEITTHALNCFKEIDEKYKDTNEKDLLSNGLEALILCHNLGLKEEIQPYALFFLQENLGILREKTKAKQVPSTKDVKQSIEAIILCEKYNVKDKNYKKFKKEMRPLALGYLQKISKQNPESFDVKEGLEAIILCQKCKVRGTDYENFKKQVRDIIKNHPEIGVATGELGNKYDAKAVNNAVNQKNSGNTFVGRFRETFRGTRFRGKATTAVQLQEANNDVGEQSKLGQQK